MHKTHCVIEEIQSFEEAAENLRVVTVEPLAPYFDSVLAVDDGEIVSCIGAPKDFVYGWLEKEGLTEAEGEGRRAVRRTNIRVWHGSGIGRVARPIFASVGKMRLVEFAARNGAEPVRIDCLDF